jgi:hypothetical protein
MDRANKVISVYDLNCADNKVTTNFGAIISYFPHYLMITIGAD